MEAQCVSLSWVMFVLNKTILLSVSNRKHEKKGTVAMDTDRVLCV